MNRTVCTLTDLADNGASETPISLLTPAVGTSEQKHQNNEDIITVLDRNRRISGITRIR